MKRREVGEGGERSRERVALERESGELGESIEIGRKSACEIMRSKVDDGDTIAFVASNVIPLTAVYGGGPAAWGGVEGG